MGVTNDGSQSVEITDKLVEKVFHEASELLTLRSELLDVVNSKKKYITNTSQLCHEIANYLLTKYEFSEIKEKCKTLEADFYQVGHIISGSR